MRKTTPDVGQYPPFVPPDLSCCRAQSGTEGGESPYFEVGGNIYQDSHRRRGRRIRFRQPAFSEHRMEGVSK